MEPKDQVSALLAEYNTLRAEVLAARNAVVQGIGIGTPVCAALVPVGYYSVVGVVVIVIVLIGIWNDQNTRAFTARLRTLENRINKLAGNDLLSWETEHGWGSIFPPHSNPSFRVPPH